jgi:uncharacterized protein (DUF362 family)
MDEFINILNFNENHDLTIKDLSNYYSSIKNLKDYFRKIIPVLDIANKTILLKPNLVLHPTTEDEKLCLITHPNFILAITEFLLEHGPKKIIIGDAPVQGCEWDQLFTPEFHQTIQTFSENFNIPIIIKDFRRTIFNKAKNMINKERSPLSDYYLFDLGKKSNLEPISSVNGKFRVTDYDPDRLKKAHTIGIHKYCITKELFEADIVITLPKIKTHQKTGITGALKILVGINGDKDFLPHHRIGGVTKGGDCYPGDGILRSFAEKLLDRANKNIGNYRYRFWKILSFMTWIINKPDPQKNLSAAWYGNDTTWRMVLDLNLIAKYGKADGSISEIPQRKIYSLCDGIIGGQGDGPLHPRSLKLGIISFSNNSTATDLAMTYLMGFDPKKIPLIQQSLIQDTIDQIKVHYNCQPIKMEELIKYNIFTEPAPGWVNHIEHELQNKESCNSENISINKNKDFRKLILNVLKGDF